MRFELLLVIIYFDQKVAVFSPVIVTPPSASWVFCKCVWDMFSGSRANYLEIYGVDVL